MELHEFLPAGDSGHHLLLDCDMIVLGDIELGFKMAEMHAIAVSPALHYSLDTFWGFDRITEREGLPELGQLLYNTGVIFLPSGRREGRF